VGQPDASSKLCLSCHDGTVALENFGGTTTGTHFISGAALLGTDLRNDHPVSFTYDAALASADGGLKNPTTTPSGMGGTITANMLFSGKMQCASCHDVHNSGGQPDLLVKSNNASALCLTCHSK
jgi:predicted CXXCH cytochrome family protein